MPVSLRFTRRLGMERQFRMEASLCETDPMARYVSAVVDRYSSTEGLTQSAFIAQAVKYPTKRETREFNGKQYIMEEAIKGDVAFIRAWKVDEAGNVIFRYAAHNFSAAMARSARMTIVEAEEIVPIGSLDPMQIHLPGIYVNRIVKATTPKEIEIETLAPEPGSQDKAEASLGTGDARAKREQIVKVRGWSLLLTPTADTDTNVRPASERPWSCRTDSTSTWALVFLR